LFSVREESMSQHIYITMRTKPSPLPPPERRVDYKQREYIRAVRLLDEFKAAVRRGEVTCDGKTFLGFTTEKCPNIATRVVVNDVYEYYGFCEEHGK